MATNYTMWTHGTSVQVEDPNRIISILRQGFGTTIRVRTGGDSWFHFTIPTPAIVSDRRLRIARVLLEFAATASHAVDEVHVHDGNTPIDNYQGLNLHGQIYREYQVRNAPEVQRGLSIKVSRGPGEPAPQGEQHWIFFISAGAVFYIPDVVRAAPDDGGVVSPGQIEPR